jgi:chromatin remodeling complex protein RSC6
MSKSTKKSESASTSVSTTELIQEAKVNLSEPVVEAESKDNLTYTSYIELQNELSAIQERLSVLRANLKKHYKLTSKQMQKMNKGRKQNTNPRSPTGFGKPCFVPSTLRTLLKLDENECVTRPTVTKKLYSYIKENSLFDANDKRLLRVNDSLSKALQLSPQEVKLINSSTSPYLPEKIIKDGKEKNVIDKNAFSFYNIQRYVARLYPKQDTEENKQVAEVKKEKTIVEVVADKKPTSTPAVKKSK